MAQSPAGGRSPPSFPPATFPRSRDTVFPKPALTVSTSRRAQTPWHLDSSCFCSGRKEGGGPAHQRSKWQHPPAKHCSMVPHPEGAPSQQPLAEDAVMDVHMCKASALALVSLQAPAALEMVLNKGQLEKLSTSRLGFFGEKHGRENLLFLSLPVLASAQGCAWMCCEVQADVLSPPMVKQGGKAAQPEHSQQGQTRTTPTALVHTGLRHIPAFRDENGHLRNAAALPATQ